MLIFFTILKTTRETERLDYLHLLFRNLLSSLKEKNVIIIRGISVRW